MSKQLESIKRIAILGNHVPRRCGIATFTYDVAKSLRKAGVEVDVVAMSDQPGYDYPGEVVFDIAQDDLSAYGAAAARLNVAGYDLVNVQHEYGIFGGAAGEHLLTLMRDLKMPIVTTLHTVLQRPNADQRAVLEEIIGLSQRIIVMSQKACDLLTSIHGVPVSKISLIPHGIPNLPSTNSKEIRKELGFGDEKIVLTFGLVSPSKGMEYAIEAMADVPDATYVIVGQTHPHVRRDSGEAYRDSLNAKAEEFGVADRIKFVDRFVGDDELGQFLKITDVYVTPYLNIEQITSGTLAYTVGNGKAVVSTPYWHAEELLADGCGVLVPVRDSAAIAEAVNHLLRDDVYRRGIEAKAAAKGETMRWPAVAHSYKATFADAMAEVSSLLKDIAQVPVASKLDSALPEIRLDHLDILTDDTGIVQHATYSVPNRDEGYCIDDNARALLLTVELESAGCDDQRLPRLQNRYLAFCSHGLNRENGRFRNFMSFDRRWLEEQGSEDSHGRTLWCLGNAAKRATTDGVRSLAKEVFDGGKDVIVSFTSPRAWAYSILGLVTMNDYDLTSTLVDKLLSLYDKCASAEWPWFETTATYANSRIPQALILGGRLIGNARAVQVGLDSLNWLCEVQNVDGRYSPIGNEGFYPSDGRPARFDQQPIEATAHVSACLTAYSQTRDSKWRREAERAFGWFIGRNILGTSIADTQTGGCRDGLNRNGPNHNEGAESTISYLNALAELRAAIVPAKKGTLL